MTSKIAFTNAPNYNAKLFSGWVKKLVGFSAKELQTKMLFMQNMTRIVSGTKIHN